MTNSKKKIRNPYAYYYSYLKRKKTVSFVEHERIHGLLMIQILGIGVWLTPVFKWVTGYGTRVLPNESTSFGVALFVIGVALLAQIFYWIILSKKKKKRAIELYSNESKKEFEEGGHFISSLWIISIGFLIISMAVFFNVFPPR